MTDLETRSCSRAKINMHEPHEYHSPPRGGPRYWCPGKSEDLRRGNGERPHYVLVLIDADGAHSVIGSATGRPFRSIDGAREIEELYPASEGFTTYILPVEKSE